MKSTQKYVIMAI